MRDTVSRLLDKVSGARPTEPPAARAAERQLQILLRLGYLQLAAAGQRLAFDDVAFDVYSSTGEDGILLYIFSLIGTESRRAVDIGAGGVMGSNVANLIVSHGFDALLIDGDATSLDKARAFYAARPETATMPPRTLAARVTADNVNALLEEQGFAGELDLLCIDIDGVDYWIWKAIEVADPRVVVEYQDILGPERAWTVPYKPDFTVSAFEVNRERYNYCGASLRAFVKLAAAKGYRLVGCNRGGFNAFFVKRTLAPERLPEVSVQSCFRYRWNRFGMEERFPLVKDMEWEEV